MPRFLPLVVPLACLLAAGCGSGGSGSAKTSALPAAASKAKGAVPPAALLGTYTTTLRKSDLPTPVPPELQGQARWTLKITKAGGINNAPTLTIIRPPSDVLESSTVSVSGGTLTLSNEECAQSTGDALVTSAYRWKRAGDTLRLTTAKAGCPDKVAQTILTSELWKRS